MAKLLPRRNMTTFKLHRITSSAFLVLKLARKKRRDFSSQIVSNGEKSLRKKLRRTIFFLLSQRKKRNARRYRNNFYFGHENIFNLSLSFFSIECGRTISFSHSFPLLARVKGRQGIHIALLVSSDTSLCTSQT